MSSKLFNRNYLIPFNDELVTKFDGYIDAFNAYYYGDAIMSDAEFDELEDELTADLDINQIIQLEKSRIFELNKSDNNHVSVSLDKIKEDKKDPTKNIFFDLQKWWLKHNINYRQLDFYIAPKFDGGALKIELNYEQEIVKIITRGGVDYTNKLKNNTSIKLLIHDLKKLNKSYTIITGEMVISKSLFAIKYDYETQEDRFSHFKKLKNPRNAVNSLIASDDPEVYNDLKFIPLTDGVNPIIIDLPGYHYWSEVKSQELISTLKARYNHYNKNDYLLDGIVVAFNTKKRIIKNNYPLNMVALKFQNAGKQMKVIDIKWTQKKTGKMNPVVWVEPTMLDGALITKLTLYNYDQLVNVYECGIGAIIEVRKGDEITPKIFKTITKSNKFNVPENTHISGKYLMYDIDDDEKSTEHLKQKFILGLKCLNLEGIGPKISAEIGQLSEFDYNILQVFNPENKSTLAEYLGPMSASFKNFCKVYDIKNIQLNTVIEMLQINGCGSVLSLKFAEMMTGLKPYSSSGIDENVFNSVVNGDSRLLIAESISKLKSFGVRVIKPISADSESITFEMTGNPPGMSKSQFKNKLSIKYPNALHTTLTKNTKYLVCDDLAGKSSKLNKARRYNIKIVTYQEVLDGGFK